MTGETAMIILAGIALIAGCVSIFFAYKTRENARKAESIKNLFEEYKEE